MTSIQTFIVEPGTPELAICAQWRANAFSVLHASFEEESKSLELFASDQSHGIALASQSERVFWPSLRLSPTMTYRHGLQACLLSPSIGERGQALYWFEPSSIKRDNEDFRGPLHHRCRRVLC